VLANFGRRLRATLAVGVLALLVIALTPTPPARMSATGSSAAAGPALLTSSAARSSALTCHGILDDAARPPVLLVPGTAVTPEENWAPTYLPVLLDRGHAVCTVRLPDFATKDVQANAEYVVTAIRTMAARSSRRISIIGHSQGTLLSPVALRMWSDLSPHVDDVIGLAGVYDHGSQEIAARCATRCTPVLHQLAAGSAFLADIRRRALPSGPTYTNIGTLGDTTVTPQPAANQQPGAHSILVQDVCPGRTVPISEHAFIVGDAVALALTLDALDHPGTADLGRLDPNVCADGQYPEFNVVQYLAASTLTGIRAGVSTTSEPHLYCRHRSTCRYPRLRGFLVTAPAFTIGRHSVVVRTRALGPGRVKIRLGDRRVVSRVQAGPVSIRVRRPVGRAQLVVKTRPRHYSAWGVERTKRIPGR